MLRNERKITQVATYFLIKRGGRMSHLKLMKLLYLSERESLKRYALPISWDCLVSMPHGPVLSQTLDLMDGNVKSQKDGWDDWINTKENHELELKNVHVGLDELDELSQADLEILDDIWNQFGKMNRYEIRDYTHSHCSEWENPHGSSYPITYKKVFSALGDTEEVAKEKQDYLQQLMEENTFFRCS